MVISASGVSGNKWLYQQVVVLANGDISKLWYQQTVILASDGISKWWY
jgi:hypothetical protein